MPFIIQVKFVISHSRFNLPPHNCPVLRQFHKAFICMNVSHMSPNSMAQLCLDMSQKWQVGNEHTTKIHMKENHP